MKWYYAENNKQMGPFEEDEFKGLVTGGRVTAQTLVWHAGMPAWAAYETVAETVPEESGEPADATASGRLHVTETCSECGNSFPASQMVRYEGAYICATCKPAFFQKIQEGAPTVSGGGTGTTPNTEIMIKARLALQGQWGTAIGICVVFVIISGAIGAMGSLIPFAGNFLQLFLVPPFSLGLVMFFIAITRGEEAGVGMIGRGFSRYWPAVGTSLLQQLIVNMCMLLAALPAIGLFVWGALDPSKKIILFTLGSIAAIPAVYVAFLVSFMYIMCLYVLADDTTAGVMDSLRRSQQMMKGMKWKMFCLHLRFFGWSILGILTCLIGFLWLIPYIATSIAIFYDDVRGRLNEG